MAAVRRELTEHGPPRSPDGAPDFANVGIADWASAFGDATVATAMLDRLLHRATVVGIDGPSCRLRHHQNHAETLRQGVNARVSWT
ncbi:ATP-binding protein [Streptomyces canus]|uniref:ATP-binding protein n=1 Tax=Streptomyces canus TaxID=58343 RepID=UPI0033AAB504